MVRSPERLGLALLLVIAGAALATIRPVIAAPTADTAQDQKKKDKQAAKREAKNAKNAKNAKHAKHASKQDPKAKNDKNNQRDRTTPTTSTSTPTATRIPSGPTLPPCPPASPLTYRSFGAGVLRTWCTGCHSSTLPDADRQGAPDDVNFDRPGDLAALGPAIYERAVLEAAAFEADPNGTAAPMPPAGIIPAADRARLTHWLACGAPGAKAAN